MIRAALVALVLTGCCCPNARRQAQDELDDCRWKFEANPRLTTEEKADLVEGCNALYRMRIEGARR